MTILDVVLLLLLFGFVFFGFWVGLIHALGGLVGAIVGAVVASRLFEPVVQQWGYLFGGNQNLARIVIFLIIFIIVNRLVGLAFWLLEKMFNVIAIIPFLKTINRLGGAIFGLIEGVLVIGVTIYVASRFPLGATFTEGLQGSSVAKKLVELSGFITPLLPVFLKQIRSMIGI